MAAQLTLRPTRNAGGRRVAQLLDEWLAFNELTWAPLTFRDHQSRVGQIKDDPIAQLAVAAIAVSDVDRWVTRLRRFGVGESAIRNRHAVLRAALQQAVRWEWISTNPASSAPVRSPKRTQRAVMCDEDVHRVLEAAASISEFAGLALRLAAETGARRAELSALRWDSLVDELLVIESQVVVVVTPDGSRTPKLQPTKTGNRRAVALGASTLAVLQAMQDEWSPSTTWMFSPDEPPPNPDRIGWWWKRARKLAGIDPRWRLHDLRHWSATHAIASGADVRTVASRGALSEGLASSMPRWVAWRSRPVIWERNMVAHELCPGKGSSKSGCGIFSMSE